MSVEAPENVTLTPVGATSFDVSWVRPGGAHLDIEISYSFAVFVREVRNRSRTKKLEPPPLTL